MDTKTEIIEKILDGFDFHAVYNYTEHVKYEFFDGSKYRRPSIDDLKDTARKLLEKVYGDNEMTNYIIAYGTCNFEASKTADGLLSLRYYIAESDLDLEDFFSNF